jgi:hypothetical protein
LDIKDKVQNMKRTIIKFSVLLMIFLLSGVGNALAQTESFAFQNMSFNVTYSSTGIEPGDTVNITAYFDKPVDHANISITPNLTAFDRSNPNNPLVGASEESLVTDAPMTEIGENAFSYESLIPQELMGLFDVGITPFDDSGNPLGDGGTGFDIGGFEVDPYIDIICPTSEFAIKNCVDFNFTGYDYAGYGQTGGEIVYTFWLDGVQVNNGIITSGTYKQLQFELADGKHTWEIQTKDNMGQDHTTGTRTLYVDTKCPIVTLVSPQDCFKQVIGATQFNFTCEDALAAQYSNLGLSYVLYVDGQVAKRFGNMGDNITGTTQSGVPVTQNVQLADGAHNWTVAVQDRAGNSVTSEVRKFYVDLNGLTVSSVSPNGIFVSSNPTFNFTVTGGTGLPFNYKLLVDGKEIMASNCDSCNGGYNGDEGEDGCNTVCCSEGGCDGSCFVVGQNVYSLKAAVSDGVNKNWTVIVTDSTTGKTYQTDLKTFSVDSVAPAPVEHLVVLDSTGETYWTELSNSPGLNVYWIPNNETDLAQKPYEVYISTSKPSCIEDMELVNSTYLPIDGIANCSGKPLVYGKDYWVAVIARDNATNYDKSFSLVGPVQTYEDMEITLNEGWNLKSVPKSLVDACPESVFGTLEGCTVLYWDGSCWQFPDTIEPCKGYWVYTNRSCMNNVKFKGMPSSGNPDVPSSLILTPGWHMIGHSSTYCAPWNMTLASLSDFSGNVLDGLLSIDSYRFSNLITYGDGEGWGGIIPEMTDELSIGYPRYISGNNSLPVGALQTDGYMVPGQGYWIFMKDEGTYASIENVYNLDILQDTYGGTNGGTNGGMNELPGGFDLNDQGTWPVGFELPNGFDLNNQGTWGGYDFSEFLP